MKRILTCVVCALLAIANAVTLFSSCKEPEPLPDPIIYTPESPYILENYQPSDEYCHRATVKFGVSADCIYGYNTSFAESISSYSEDYCIVKGKKISSKSYYWKENGLGFLKDSETLEPDIHSMEPDDNYEEKFFGGYTETTVEITEVMNASGMEISQGDTVKLIENYAVDIDGVIAEGRLVYKYSSEEDRKQQLIEFPELLKKDATYLFIFRKADILTEESNVTKISIKFTSELRVPESTNNTVLGWGEMSPTRIYGTYIRYRAYEISEEAQNRAQIYLQKNSNYFKKYSSEKFAANGLHYNTGKVLYYRYLYEANEMYLANAQKGENQE